MYYRVCPNCGCNLDPGERCECDKPSKETAPLPRKRPLTKVSTVSISAQTLAVKNARGCLNG